MFFAYLFAVDCLPWEILGIVRLTENDTTSSSRIFLKELFWVFDYGLTAVDCRR